MVILQELNAIRYELHVRLGHGRARSFVLIHAFEDGTVKLALRPVPRT